MIIKNNLNGQAMLVLVIITMIAALTIGGSIAARSIISNRQTTYNIQNESAFTLADSGIELAIKNINDSIANNQAVPTGELTGTLDNNNYKYEIKKEGDTQGELTMPIFPLNKNQIEVFLLDKKAETFTVTWHYNTNTPVPLEINFIKKELTGEYNLTQRVYDCHSPSEGATANTQFLLTPTIVASDKSCTATESTGVLNNEYDLVQIVPRVNNTSKVKVVITPKSGQTIPLQGYTIISRGTSGDSQRAVTVLYMLPSLARIFNNTLYAQSVVNN